MNVLSWVAQVGGRPLVIGTTALTAILVGVALAKADVPDIAIDNFTFVPAVLTVVEGTTVTWSNADDIPHAVVAVDRSFKSKTLDTNDRFSFTFTTPGEYAYFCSLHPHMTGKVVVRPR